LTRALASSTDDFFLNNLAYVEKEVGEKWAESGRNFLRELSRKINSEEEEEEEGAQADESTAQMESLKLAGIQIDPDLIRASQPLSEPSQNESSEIDQEIQDYNDQHNLNLSKFLNWSQTKTIPGTNAESFLLRQFWNDMGHKYPRLKQCAELVRVKNVSLMQFLDFKLPKFFKHHRKILQFGYPGYSEEPTKFKACDSRIIPVNSPLITKFTFKLRQRASADEFLQLLRKAAFKYDIKYTF